MAEDNLYGAYGQVSYADGGAGKDAHDSTATAHGGGSNSNGGGPANPDESKTDADGLPKFAAGKLYLLRPETLEALKRAIRTNKPKAVTGGGIKVDDQGENGQHISLSG